MTARSLVRRAAGRVPTARALLVLVALLCVVGVVMVGSASEVISIATYGTPWGILLRELLWMVVGIAVLAVTCRADYRRWRRWRTVLLAVTFVLLMGVLVPGIGVHSGGSSRWIGFGQFRLQPSELLKLAMAIFGADLIVRREQEGADQRRIVGPLLLTAAAGAGIVLLQPDMGTALVISCITMALLFASGVSLRPVLKSMAGLVGIAFVVGMIDPYRRARLLAFLHPSAHASGSAYQSLQSLIGLGSGHLFGLGLGNGREKWGLLPNAHTDFIFSVIGEELGLVGALFVLFLLAGLAWLGLRAAERAPDRFGSLLAVAIVAWLVAETFVNVGAVVGLLPVTGVPLPFVSYGGSSLVITMAATGVLINIARQERPAGVLAGPAGSVSRAVPGRRQSPLAAR